MPLRSSLLHGDSKLEACLLNDARVPPGDAGPHVTRIQTALMAVEGAPIPGPERSAGRYGPATTAAVQSFNRKWGIITFPSQLISSVGKATIGRLDQQMLLLESQLPSGSCCSSQTRQGSAVLQGASAYQEAGVFATVGGGPASAGSLADFAMPVSAKNYKKTLNLVWQKTSLAVKHNADRQLAQYRKAGDLLAPFGILVSACTDSGVIDYDHLVNTGNPGDIHSVRLAAEKKLSGHDNELRVILCVFEPDAREFAFTPGGHTSQWKRYVLINCNKFREDETTLIHEMIHGAGDDPHTTDPRNIFTWTWERRDKLEEPPVEHLATSWFATSRT